MSNEKMKSLTLRCNSLIRQLNVKKDEKLEYLDIGNVYEDYGLRDGIRFLHRQCDKLSVDVANATVIYGCDTLTEDGFDSTQFKMCDINNCILTKVNFDERGEGFVLLKVFKFDVVGMSETIKLLRSKGYYRRTNFILNDDVHGGVIIHNGRGKPDAMLRFNTALNDIIKWI